jgi:hypothetical protein
MPARGNARARQCAGDGFARLHHVAGHALALKTIRRGRRMKTLRTSARGRSRCFGAVTRSHTAVHNLALFSHISS